MVVSEWRVVNGECDGGVAPLGSKHAECGDQKKEVAELGE